MPFAASRRTELLASALRILLSAAQHSVLPFFTPVGASWQRCATDFLADLLAHSASPSLGSSRSSGRRVPTAAEVLRQAEQYCFLASQLGEGEQAAAGVRRCSVRSAACLGFGPNRVFLPFIMSYNAHPKVDACAACFASKHRVHRS